MVVVTVIVIMTMDITPIKRAITASCFDEDGCQIYHKNCLKVETEFTVDPTEDMNALCDKDLKRRKELMDLAFEKNRVKIGDPDFIYDKQVC